MQIIYERILIWNTYFILVLLWSIVLLFWYFQCIALLCTIFRIAPTIVPILERAEFIVHTSVWTKIKMHFPNIHCPQGSGNFPLDLFSLQYLLHFLWFTRILIYFSVFIIPTRWRSSKGNNNSEHSAKKSFQNITWLSENQ